MQYSFIYLGIEFFRPECNKTQSTKFILNAKMCFCDYFNLNFCDFVNQIISKSRPQHFI